MADDAHPLRRHPQHRRQVEAQSGDAAAGAGIEREAAARLVVFGDVGARLHRRAGNALDPAVKPHHVRGACEGRLGRHLVANLDIDAQIAGRHVPKLRSIGLDRVYSAGDRRQRVIGNVKKLGGVLGRGNRQGDDHCDRLADKAHPVGRHRMMQRRDRRYASQPRHDIGRPAQAWVVRDRPEPVGAVVGAGQHGENTGRRQRRSLVDLDNPRVRMGRANEHRVYQAGRCHIVDKTAASCQQAEIFLAPDRLTDAVGPAFRCLHGAKPSLCGNAPLGQFEVCFASASGRSIRIISARSSAVAPAVSN